MTENYLFALANFALCAAIAFMAFCRLNAMHGAVLLRVRSEYAVYLAVAIVCAFQPWWGEWPRWGSLLITAALGWGLLTSKHAWRDGPPESTSQRADL